MAVSLTALAPLTTAAGALSNLVLVSPQTVVGLKPQAPAGTEEGSESVTPLLFHYEGEQAVDLESDITDHYVEDNTAVQDHIALRPERYKVQGYIGELNDVATGALAVLKAAAERLRALEYYTPGISATATLAYNEAAFLAATAKNVANTAVSAWNFASNLISGSDGQSVVGKDGLITASSQNKQQTMFQQLYGYWAKRTLFTVQTPFCVFQDMAIESIRAVQTGEDSTISDFEVNFKRLRYAKSGESTIDKIKQERLSSASEPLKDLGTSSASGGGPSLANGFELFGV